MFGLSKDKSSETASGVRGIRHTSRSDWNSVLVEVYSRVIDGCRFGIGVLTTEKNLLSTKVVFRLNQDYPDPAVIEYIRRKFNAKCFNRFFSPDAGLSTDSTTGILKVGDGSFGLPGKSLVAPFKSNSGEKKRAVVVFGGTRLEGQIDARLKALDSVLGSERPTITTKDRVPVTSHNELVEALNKINLKRLFDYKLDQLALIVNGLEETKEQLSLTMKPKFNTVNQYLLAKRLGK